jgi:tetratricopeptide (TPR) repeat protein
MDNHIRNLLNRLKNKGNMEELYDTYEQQGIDLFKKGNIEDSTEVFIELVEIAKKHKENKIVARTYYNLGLNYSKIPDYNSAINYYNESIKLFKQLKDQRRLAIVLDNNSKCLERNNEYVKSLNVALDALDIWSNLNEINFIHDTLITVGISLRKIILLGIETNFVPITSQLGELHDKLVSTTKSYDQKKYVDTMNQLRIVKSELSRREHKRTHVKSDDEWSKDVSPLSGRLNMVGDSFFEQGGNHQSSDRFSEALICYQEAKKEYQKSNDYENVLFTNNHIAHMQNRLNDYRSALETLAETFYIFHKYRSMGLREEHLELASDLSVHCFKEALQKKDIGASVNSFLNLMKIKYILLHNYIGEADFERFLFDITLLEFTSDTVFGVFTSHAHHFLNQIYLLAGDPAQSVYYRAFLLYILSCKTSTDYNVSFITKFSSSGNIILRRISTFALWGQASRSSLILLRKLLHDDDSYIIGFAIGALGYIEDIESEYEIARYVDHPNDFIRKRALEAYEIIRGQRDNEIIYKI